MQTITIKCSDKIAPHIEFLLRALPKSEVEVVETEKDKKPTNRLKKALKEAEKKDGKSFDDFDTFKKEVA